MRLLALWVLASCTIGDRAFRLPPRPQLVTPEPAPRVVEITDLRTTLGRAGITVEVRGAMTLLQSSGCEDPDDACTKCELAGAHDEPFQQMIEALTKGFERYPTQVLEAARLERVALCRTIEHVGTSKRPGGTAITSEHLLLISFEYFTGEAELGGQVLEDVAHHELYHLLDWEWAAHTPDGDPEWSGLNPAGFEYGTTPPVDDQPGFVNAYAMTTATEDRASLFQMLMMRPDATCKRAADDPVLAAKIELLVRRLATHVDTAFLRVPCATIKPESPLVRRYRDRSRAELLREPR